MSQTDRARDRIPRSPLNAGSYYPRSLLSPAPSSAASSVPSVKPSVNDIFVTLNGSDEEESSDNDNEAEKALNGFVAMAIQAE